MRRSLPLASLTVLFVMLPLVVSVQSPRAGAPVKLAGLHAAAQITRDTNDIPHLSATNEHDLYFLQGYVQAQDRLFQMDYSRRQAAGTLAELLGPAAIPADVQLRTFGLRRAAEASLAVLSPDTLAALDAYTEGVNAFVAANPALPPEYAALGVAHFEPWTAVDSVAIGKLIAFGLSFDLSDIARTTTLLTYQAAGPLLGIDGTKLFFDDLVRSQPFTSASTIPDASVAALSAARASVSAAASASEGQDIDVQLARNYLDRVKDIPLVQRYIKRENRPHSNEWAIGPAHSASGRAMVANDPHLALDTPAVWHPVHLSAGRIDVIGNSFPGVPFVVLGHNRDIGWGATVNPLDVTDVFQEQVAVDPTSPSGLSIVHDGVKEPIVPIPEAFFALISGQLVQITSGVPQATLVVPRRNNGPIISLDLKPGAPAGTALSVAFTGFGPTRELDTFRMFDEAQGVDDFETALRFFGFGSQNFAYADVNGNIAYFTSAEMPIRTDLQAGTVVGLPPYFIRNGATSLNDWLPVQHPQPGQLLPFEILPAAEMPHIVNPPAGWFINCNNDPIGNTLDNNPLNELRPGGGIFYLSPGYDGFRAGRVTELVHQALEGGGKISFEQMQGMQSDVVLIDAQYFVPFISRAFDNASAEDAPLLLQAVAANPAVVEAIGRLRAWDFSTPTGIPQGFDAVQNPSNDANSVAATIYAVWRGQFVKNVIDSRLASFGLPTNDDASALTALRHLLDTFDTNHGVGESGFPFLVFPSFSPPEARDMLLLESLSGALQLLAGPAFADAFHNSSDQNDYRWGLLHRIVFEHPLDSIFSIPPAGGAFPPPLATLSGIPTDGGFDTVDAATHNVRAASVDAFMFAHGPSNRSVHEGATWGMHGVSSLPGGVSGVLGSPFYANLLTAWLRNQAYQQLQRQNDIVHNTMTVVKFVPSK